MIMFFVNSFRKIRSTLALALVLVLCLAGSASVFAQQKDKDSKKKKKAAAEVTDSTASVVPLPDIQQIDYLISDMLGAWQLGDIEKLRKDYADDVSVVNGNWVPPVIGWNTYLAAYQQQRARMQQVRMDRSNTYIRVNGNVSWAGYQWDFAASVDGQPVAFQGHTTLIMEKRDNRWVIVHNHTSLAQQAQQAAPAGTPTPASAPAA